MRSRSIDALVACITVAVLCACAVWPACSSAQPDAQPPDEFDKMLRNPLQPRDHSRRVDRLGLTDSADAFRAGDMKDVVVTDGKAPRAVLAQTSQVGFPRRGTWTGPETVADFPFTDLVPSWNAMTPKDTGVFFQVRTRDAKSREWSKWMFVGRWGRTIHARPGDDLPNNRVTRFAYGAVRTDMPCVLLSQPADAYQVRATLQSFDLDLAVNPSIRKVAIAYSGMITDPEERARFLGTVKLEDAWARDLPVPHFSQHDAPPALRESVCLPASVAMLLAYWKVDRPLAETALAIYDPDSGMFGNGARAAARAGELGLDSWMQRVRNWDQVKAMIGRGQPVIASIGMKDGEHLIVIRGFTRDGDVIVNDPLDHAKGGTTRKADDLGRAWFDCGGIAIVICRPAAK